jgi:hypothetical protein
MTARWGGDEKIDLVAFDARVGKVCMMMMMPHCGWGRGIRLYRPNRRGDLVGEVAFPLSWLSGNSCTPGDLVRRTEAARL